ncbi:MAG TPA: CDP-alcohol phosphatidyltransferase family protein [Roseiarcus sp.]|nr:CDP-alcohol phosphatidyltransferase family protein [Roseiarcus sp.]
MTIADTGRGFASAKVAASLGAFVPPMRIQASILARRERSVLDHLCEASPQWVTPDRLTAAGFIGAVVTAAGYVASNLSHAFLFLASFGLILNWFGDSLDGSLARYRKLERHRYGFFLDHSVDAGSNLLITIGLGLSPFVSMEVALFTLVGYLLLALFVFLSHQVSGALRLSFLGFGPTELRLIMVSLNTTMFLLGPLPITLLGREFSRYDVSVGILGLVLIGLFAVNTYRTVSQLARQA